MNLCYLPRGALCSGYIYRKNVGSEKALKVSIPSISSVLIRCAMIVFYVLHFSLPGETIYGTIHKFIEQKPLITYDILQYTVIY
jgi:hypothetical protein